MLYYIIFGFFWLLTLLPLRLLYIISDFIYFLIFHVFRYRKQIIKANIQIAFPDKNEVESRKIARQFYRNFADQIMEYFKLINMSPNELNKRFVYKNMPVLNDLLDCGKGVVLVSGHIGNWEWMVNIQTHLRHKYLAIYKPLSDKNFDRMVKYWREKFSVDGELVTMKNIYKRIIELEKEKTKAATWFLADQSPPSNYPTRIEFFGVETPFYSGPAKMAKKFNFAVVYLEIIKLSRGKYQASFRILNENPANSTEEDIMKSYVKAIEESIKVQPDAWLWSHRRWKHVQQIGQVANS